jgi:aldehyde dehydrogenase (NAD+)
MSEAGKSITPETAGTLFSPGLVVEKLRRYFLTGATRPVSFRIKQLRALEEAVNRGEQEILEALYADLRKSPVDAYSSEVGFVQADITHALRHIQRWTRPERRRTPLVAWPGSSAVYPEPYGVALLISPWNYPFQLTLSPLVGAVAAGNCVCIKPSELAPHTSRVIARLIGETFPVEYVAAVKGDREAVQALLQERFDHIFYTGSATVGRVVMEAAAQHLTPVALELGGKSPCIVCNGVDIETTARRILWGKFLNAGQTCVAPDYVLVDRHIERALLDALSRTLERFYGESPHRSEDFGRIVNRRHFDRLVKLLSHGRVAHGGEYDEQDLYIGPTVMTEVDRHSPLMQEEIFGPILPVIPFDNLDEVLETLAQKPKPLALYLFARDKDVQKRVIAETSSGGVCINDTISHILGKDLPFGGVGLSGMGTYHGKAGFDCFTHYKSVMRRAAWIDPSLRYPPASISLPALKRVYRYLLGR